MKEFLSEFMSSQWFPVVLVVVAFAVIMATLKREQRLRYLYIYAAGAGIMLAIKFLSAIPPRTIIITVVVVCVAASLFWKKKVEP